MNELIDLSLLAESRSLLGTLLRRRGLTWFLAKESPQPLFSLEHGHVELVVRTAAAKLAHRGRAVHPKAAEHCRKEIRRELIRRVTGAMMRAGY